MGNAFAKEGKWFKGNLHVHTTESDGKVSPQEAVTMYAANGYDFLAITDHRKVTLTTDIDHKHILMLPGVELNGGKSDIGGQYHLVAIGAEGPMEGNPEWSAQELIDYGNKNAEFVFAAHPYWLTHALPDLLNVEGLLGLEVYNTTCQRHIGRGESSVQWDDQLVRGRHFLGFAVDDAHWDIHDYCISSIMVKAEECTQEQIIAAIKAGEFYSTNGPHIHNIERDGNVFHVECSACWEVNAICPKPGHGCSTWRLKNKPPFTQVDLEIPADAFPVRIECINEVGNKAWSNPFWAEDK